MVRCFMINFKVQAGLNGGMYGGKLSASAMQRT